PGASATEALRWRTLPACRLGAYPAMMITCSNCQAKIRVPDAAAGKRGKCPKCQTVITIPATGEPSGDDMPAAEEQAAGSPFDFNEPAAPPPTRKGKGKAADEQSEEADKPKQESKGLS